MAPEVLCHRVLLTYDGLAEGIRVDDIVGKILRTIEAPRIAPHQDERSGITSWPDRPGFVGPYGGAQGTAEQEFGASA